MSSEEKQSETNDSEKPDLLKDLGSQEKMSMLNKLLGQTDEQLQWDFISSMPLPHLSFILNQFMLSTWTEGREILDYTSYYDGYGMQTLRRLLKDKRLIIVGSLGDGLVAGPIIKRSRNKWLGPTDRADVPLPTLDIMVEEDNILVGNADQPFEKPYKLHIITKDMKPGFLRLKCMDPEAFDADSLLKRGDDAYLCDAALSRQQADTEQLLKSLQDDADKEVAPLLRSTRQMVVFHCRVWPKQAEKFVKRQPISGWPSDTLKKMITDSGCHVVQKAHPDSTWKEAEWQFSFDLAEQRLAKSLTTRQRKCFLILETLIQYELSPPDLLSTYCLKNFFFWCMEEIPESEWLDDVNGLASCFLQIIDKLLHMVIEGHLPQYMIPSNNLIAHIPEDFIADLMARLSKLRRTPVKYLLNFDKNYHLLYSPIKSSLADLLQPILKDCDKYHNQIKQCFLEQHKVLVELCKTHTDDLNFPALLACCQQEVNLRRDLGDEIELLDLYQHFVYEISDAKKNVEAFQYAMSQCSHVSSSFLSNMASIYTAVYSEETDPDTKELCRQQTDSLFKRSIEERSGDGSPAIVDYSIFLRKSGRPEEAVPLLLRIVTQKELGSGGNCYGAVESSSVDEHLKAEIEVSGTIELPSYILAFYQLLYCLIEMGKKDEALERLPDFSAACTMFNQNNALVFSLLGYINLDLGQTKEALEAFSEANKLDPENILCNAMLMSLQIHD